MSATEPVAIRINEEREILTSVFETLLATDQDGNLLPSLCEKWEVKDEGRSVLLKLRSDVRFQDGHPLTAADVKNSFERAIRRISHELPAVFTAICGAAEFAEGRANEVAGMSIHSGNQLEIQLAEPLPIYPALLADFHAGITRVTSEDNEPVSHAIGTGPFQIVSHDRERVVLSRNQDYWKGGLANLDAIEFRHGLSASAIASGLRSGELDLARDLLPQDLDEIMRDARFRAGLVEAPRKNT